MKLFKTLTAIAIAAAMLVVPAGALAKRGDRDHDRMPDRWEKAHHLNVRANDARKDADHDGLRNLAEYRNHTDPQKADTDQDGVDDNDEIRDDTNPRKDDSDGDGVGDADEVAGTVVSFDAGVLTIQLPGDGAGTVSGTVSDATRVECDDDGDTTASASRDGSDDGGSTSGTDSGDNEDRSGSSGDDDQGDDDQGEKPACTTADLKPGARVHEAKLVKATDGSTTFTKIELVPAA